LFGWRHLEHVVVSEEDDLFGAVEVEWPSPEEIHVKIDMAAAAALGVSEVSRGSARHSDRTASQQISSLLAVLERVLAPGDSHRWLLRRHAALDHCRPVDLLPADFDRVRQVVDDERSVADKLSR
jgi:hypothetical protein